MIKVKYIAAFVMGAGLVACSTPSLDKRQNSTAEPLGIDDIHQQALVLDAHADIEIAANPSRYAGDDGKSKVEPEKMAAGGVDAVVMAIAVGPMPRTSEGYADAQKKAEQELQEIENLAAQSENIVIPKSPQALQDAHKNGQLSLILGFQNALILGPQVEQIDTYFARGVRVFAMTHMGHNDYADSSRPLFISELGHHEPTAEHGGLSELGKAFVRRVNQLGGIVDISQLSKQAALQAIELSTAPVIASHSNVRSLTDVARNLSDEELDALAAKGGVIHVAPFRGYLFDSNDKELDANIRAARREAGVTEDYLYPFELYWEMDDPAVQQKFLTTVSDLLGPGNIDMMLDHVDYVVKRVGVDHVGIGTDFNHGSGVVGYNDASEAKNVTQGMIDRGYSETEIEKIWGGNFLRVWQANHSTVAQD